MDSGSGPKTLESGLCWLGFGTLSLAVMSVGTQWCRQLQTQDVDATACERRCVALGDNERPRLDQGATSQENSPNRDPPDISEPLGRALSRVRVRASSTTSPHGPLYLAGRCWRTPSTQALQQSGRESDKCGKTTSARKSDDCRL